MKYQLKRKTVSAIQWKGWPHKVKGMIEHPVYPQLAMMSNGLEVYTGYWIITHPDKSMDVLNEYLFEQKYERVKKYEFTKI